MFVAAIIGAERLLRVDFDARAMPIQFSFLALEGIEERRAKWGDASPGYGRPTGFRLAVLQRLDALKRKLPLSPATQP
jgi:hypothetical protein